MGFLSSRAYNSGASCSQVILKTESNEPFVGNLSFHHFNIILSGSCTAVTCVLMYGLMAMHALRFSNPNEQSKIMRIAHMLPAYSILSFIAIVWPGTYVYMTGWVEVFQAIALYAYLMLCVDFLAPRDQDKIDFFTSLKVPKSFKKGKYREGLSWFKLTYYSVVQYPLVVFICAIAACVTQSLNVYCLDSNSPKYGHIWIEVFQNLSVSFAINAIFRFYTNTKAYCKEAKPLLKLLAFKLMVGLIFIEQIAFMVLEATKVLYPTKTISYADIKIGLPNLIICLQMVPFSILMHFAYDTKPYKIHEHPDLKLERPDSNEGFPVEQARKRYQHGSYQGGPLGINAWIMFCNPFEFISDGYAVTRMLRDVRIRKQTYEDSTEIPMEQTAYTGAGDNPSTQDAHPAAATSDQASPLAEYPPVTTYPSHNAPAAQPYDHTVGYSQPHGSYGYSQGNAYDQPNPGYGYEQPSQGYTYDAPHQTQRYDQPHQGYHDQRQF